MRRLNLTDRYFELELPASKAVRTNFFGPRPSSMQCYKSSPQTDTDFGISCPHLRKCRHCIKEAIPLSFGLTNYIHAHKHSTWFNPSMTSVVPSPALVSLTHHLNFPVMFEFKEKHLPQSHAFKQLINGCETFRKWALAGGCGTVWMGIEAPLCLRYVPGPLSPYWCELFAFPSSLPWWTEPSETVSKIHPSSFQWFIAVIFFSFCWEK